jgi:hypothetical protein
VPYRIAALPEPELPEHPYVRVLRAGVRRTRLGTLAAVVAAFALGGAALAVIHGAPPGDGVLAARRADGERAAALCLETKKILADTRADLAAKQARYERAVREAVARPDTTPAASAACPVALPRPTSALTSALSGFREFPMLLVARDQVSGNLPSQAVGQVLADVSRGEEYLATGRTEEAALCAHSLRRDERLTFEVVVVTTKHTEPRVLRDDAFTPGEIFGTAYLYDHRSGEVVCAGDVHATNAPSVGYAYDEVSDLIYAAVGGRASERSASLARRLEDDLRLETSRAVADALDGL